MADVFTPNKRSEIMSNVKSHGNSATELRLIKLFRQQSIGGWRRNYALLGKPDFVFPKERLVVFIDGCFWHSCPTHGSVPMSNVEFWSRKLQRNRARDRLVTRQLRKTGWRVIRIWQHELKNPIAVTRKVTNYL